MSAPRPPVPSASWAAASVAAASGSAAALPPRAPTPAATAAAVTRAAPTPSSINASSPSSSSLLASRALAGAQSMAAALRESRSRVAQLESELSELRAELAPPPSTSSSSSSATEGTITLLYATGWKEAFCHFSKDGRAWTEVPGLKLVASSTNPGGGDRQLRIEGTKRLDFVMTDGHGNWDTPVPSYALNTSSSGNGSSGNSSDGGGSDGDSGSSSRRRKAPNHYTIEQPGSYRLKSGKITKLD